ncbi:MAG: protease SohB [Pseudomonadota bacterium]|nr:protease SohB [Pseudomonadota bacterium]
MEFVADYGMFLLKILTVVIAIIAVVLVIASTVASGKSRSVSGQGRIKVRAMHEDFKEQEKELKRALLTDEQQKQQQKAEKKRLKSEKKANKKAAKLASKNASKNTEEDSKAQKPSVFVLDFDGDIRASEVDALRQEVTAVLSLAKTTDEVVLRLESPGGVVHGYGLAASQLQRLRDQSIPLTICVDKVAASGGYMMACIGQKILAAPFAIIGSIGVVAQMPNIHRLLKKNDVDYDVYTAGEFKRTVTVMGENTEKGKAKFQEELEETHVLFKNFVQTHRPSLDISAVATGEHWFGEQAIEKGLIDGISTSDSYLVDKMREQNVYHVEFIEKKPLQERFGLAFSQALMTMYDRLISKNLEQKL